MQYSRNGLYVKRKIKARQTHGGEKKSVDFVNVFLFVLLFVVIILFIVT
ncbi:MAG: hypothetical protein NDI94_04110 [Candidatus Woesearchaeota archaeon]|nr:hypothetical protein [Candidatus Woesearchaeota archaeon]